jgi:hypothetical protein
MALLLGSALLLLGCATWHNPATGETRYSVPTYPECQKRELAQEVDTYCWRACMDRYLALRGDRNAAACQRECSQEGRTMLLDDEECNTRKARQEGWTTR